MENRPDFTLRFPRGGTLELGRRTVVMGILNVTPDSFSGDGTGEDEQASLDRALAMAEAGAGIIDVGGESTRPGAPEVDPETEAGRVIPLVRALRKRLDLPISVDRPITKYESKARAVGNPVTEFVWVRTAGDEPGMRPG